MSPVMADQIGAVLAAVKRGDIDATEVQIPRLQGAAVALATLTG
jgi:ABC-type sugar transport system substrate-binding protein